jgi:soluble lytic murein transglycosylase-like protein
MPLGFGDDFLKDVLARAGQPISAVLDELRNAVAPQDQGSDTTGSSDAKSDPTAAGPLASQANQDFVRPSDPLAGQGFVMPSFDPLQILGVASAASQPSQGDFLSSLAPAFPMPGNDPLADTTGGEWLKNTLRMQQGPTQRDEIAAATTPSGNTMARQVASAAAVTQRGTATQNTDAPAGNTLARQLQAAAARQAAQATQAPPPDAAYQASGAAGEDLPVTPPTPPAAGTLGQGLISIARGARAPAPGGKVLSEDGPIARARALAAAQATAAAAAPAGGKGGGPGVTTTASTHAAPYLEAVNRVAKEEGVPAAYLAGLIDTENSGPGSVSPAGARGLMQVVPGQGFDLPGEDWRDPETSIRQGARTLKEKFRVTGDWDRAVSAYFGYGTDAGGMTTNRYQQLFQGHKANYTEVAPETVQVKNEEPSLPEPPKGGVPGLKGLAIYQFGNEALSTGAADYLCGPIAAQAFVRSEGRNPTLQEALDLARGQGLIDSANGMHGIESTATLIRKMGGQAAVGAADPQRIADRGPGWARGDREHAGALLLRRGLRSVHGQVRLWKQCAGSARLWWQYLVHSR